MLLYFQLFCIKCFFDAKLTRALAGGREGGGGGLTVPVLWESSPTSGKLVTLLRPEHADEAIITANVVSLELPDFWPSNPML